MSTPRRLRSSLLLFLAVGAALSVSGCQTALDRAEPLNAEVLRLNREGRYREAIPRARDLLALREQALGPAHPDVAQSLNDLANLLALMGNAAGARPLLERALQIREQALESAHPDLAQTLNDLARLLMATGDYAGAQPLAERALRIREQALGPAHPDVAQSLNSSPACSGRQEITRGPGLYTSGRYGSGSRPWDPPIPR